MSTRVPVFDALVDALRAPDLRNKILYTLGMLVVFRFLAHVPLPGVDQAQLTNVLANNQLLSLLDLFSGGGLATFSIVAMGVNPGTSAWRFSEPGNTSAHPKARLITEPIAGR